MNPPREEYIMNGYDANMEAYIIDYYSNGAYKCTYSAFINHRTRTFKCYPRSLAKGEAPKGITYIPETQVKRQR